MNTSTLITGTVEHGRELGRKLGFPTANVRPDEPAPPLPANGVYAAALWVEGECGAHPCMLNQGVHPTVPGGKPTIEAHLLNYSGDLYGRRVRVEYLRFMRPERRFDGLEALQAQLRKDAFSVSEWLESARTGRLNDPEALRAASLDWAKGTAGM